MKLCAQCEKENPSSANHCMHCGYVLTSDENLDKADKLFRELNEVRKTNELLKSALEIKIKSEDNSSNGRQEPISIPPTPADFESKILPFSSPKNSKKTIALIITLTSFTLLAVGIFYYYNIYLPAKIDREAPRYYTFADKTNIRSSQEAGVDYNRMTSLNYGSELITYFHDEGGWSEVKDASGKRGYIASDYLLNKADFSILNTTFGDKESKECINTAKCRLALLNYFKNNNLDENWKVFSRSKDLKRNTVVYPRIYNKNSKYTDFAVIIKNIPTGARKILIFSFNDDESLASANESDAPVEGYISGIYINKLGNVVVEYSN